MKGRMSMPGQTKSPAKLEVDSEKTDSESTGGHLEGEIKKELLDMRSVCASATLEDIFARGTELKVSYKIPQLEGVHYVSEETTGITDAADQLQPIVVGVMAGLGLKRRKKANNDAKEKDGKMGMGPPPMKKAKTLAQKRDQLEIEIMKHGLAAIEKMYPRQYQKPHNPKRAVPKHSPIKMRPKPSDLDFEEIDVRDILKPRTHAKYIHEPAYDSVVYVSRRRGLVPLSSLCKDSKTILSSNVKLLAGRNARLGKPSLYVKHKGGLVAVGGSRRKDSSNLNIVKAPKVAKPKCDNFVPFELDDERVQFALSALHVPKRAPKIDIRQLKKMKKAKQETEEKGKSFLDTLYEKVQRAAEECEDESEEVEENVTKEIPKPKFGREESQSSEAASDTTRTSDRKSEPSGEAESAETGPDEDKENVATNSQKHEKFLLWRDSIDPFAKLDDEERPKATDEFLQMIAEHRKQSMAGYSSCDISDCFCKEVIESQVPTAQLTPVTGAQTPKADIPESEKKVRKNLNKVKRALKTLGVNVIEFDDENPDSTDAKCEKEFCRFGCVCDTLLTRPVPPIHCGKVECMFLCTCSEDSLKFASARKVGVSPAGFAKLQENSQRSLAAEERKFQNTVVTTGGRDIVMLGSSGRQKRERKVPTRYQDSDTLMLDASGKEYIQKMDDVEDNDDYLSEDPMTIKLKTEGVKDEKIRKGSVIVSKLLLPDNLQVWCMFHCQYSCPCLRFKSPFEYAPDRNVSRNVGRRSTKPKTKKQPSPEKKSPVVVPLTPVRPKIKKIPKLKLKVQRDEFGNIDAEKVAGAKLLQQQQQQLQQQNVDNKYMLANGQCARSQPWNITPNTMVRMPHKIVKADDPQAQGRTINLKEHLNDIDLLFRKKGLTQSVSLYKFKRYLKKGALKCWASLEANKPMLFITNKYSKPYIRSAIDILSIANRPELLKMFWSRTLELILSPTLKENESEMVRLVSNGLAWEVVTTNSKEDETKVSLKRKASDDTGEPEGLQSPKPPSSQTRYCEVNTDWDVGQLEPGQNLVTVTKDNRPTLRIKLPPTLAYQHWCFLKVESATGSIQCPNSTLALKSHILKDAANLSAKENTTVRIPIPVPTEAESFGVYAVPGLQSHVFVGPFTTKSKAKSELICLDDEDEKKDDDIQIISSSTAQTGRRKQKLRAKLDEEDKMRHRNIISGIVDHLVGKSVRLGEKKKRKMVSQTRLVIGQVPQTLSQAEEEDMEVIDIERSNSVEDQSLTLKSSMEEQYLANPPPYMNLRPSKHGRVILCTPSSWDGGVDARLTIVEANNAELPVRIMPKGGVMFKHPKFPAPHMVLSPSVAEAKSWYLEYMGQRKEDRMPPLQPIEGKSLLKPSDKPPVSFLEEIEGEGAGPQLKSAESREVSLLKPRSGEPTLKSFASLLKTSEMHGNLHLHQGDPPTDDSPQTHVIDNGSGQTGLAIILKNPAKAMACVEKRAQEVRLLQELAAKLENVPESTNKNPSKVQVLQSAMIEIQLLTKKAAELEIEKKRETKRRVKLFEQFTLRLKDVPLAVKKKAVYELKEIMKKSKEEPATISQNKPDHPISVPTYQPPEPNGTTPYSDATGLQAVRKGGKIPRPMNAFMLWAKPHRASLIQSGYDGATVSKLLAEQWKSLPDEKKNEFYFEAEKLKELHQQQHPEYKFSPSRKQQRPKKPQDEPIHHTNASNGIHHSETVPDQGTTPDQCEMIEVKPEIIELE